MCTLFQPTRSLVVAEKTDRTAHDALINHHLDNKTLPCLWIYS